MEHVLQTTSQFTLDVVKGLSSNPKSLPSKYFYDATGDALFQKIMQLPEYYLTRAELEIFRDKAADIVTALDARNDLQVIELGAGDGIKSKILLSEMLHRKIRFEYFPIDISGNALELLSRSMERTFTGSFPVHPLEGEYFDALESPLLQNDQPKLFLFLGSTIGNFHPREASDFIGRLSQAMKAGDQLMVGFDLKKVPQTILDAYNDPGGITRQFNLNLLRRINRELGADFNLHQFEHFAVYDPVQGAAKSYLISKQAQEVFIEAAGQKFYFKPFEAIFTEISQKYDDTAINDLGIKNELHVAASFKDSRHLFADVLYRKSELPSV